MSDETPTFHVSPVERGFRVQFDVNATREQRQRKRAIFGAFEIVCDESAQVGGDDSAPPPLAYFASSIAF